MTPNKSNQKDLESILEDEKELRKVLYSRFHFNEDEEKVKRVVKNGLDFLKETSVTKSNLRDKVLLNTALNLEDIDYLLSQDSEIINAYMGAQYKFKKRAKAINDAKDDDDIRLSEYEKMWFENFKELNEKKSNEIARSYIKAGKTFVDIPRLIQPWFKLGMNLVYEDKVPSFYRSSRSSLDFLYENYTLEDVNDIIDLLLNVSVNEDKLIQSSIFNHLKKSREKPFFRKNLDPDSDDFLNIRTIHEISSKFNYIGGKKKSSVYSTSVFKNLWHNIETFKEHLYETKLKNEEFWEAWEVIDDYYTSFEKRLKDIHNLNSNLVGDFTKHHIKLLSKDNNKANIFYRDFFSIIKQRDLKSIPLENLKSLLNGIAVNYDNGIFEESKVHDLYNLVFERNPNLVDNLNLLLEYYVYYCRDEICQKMGGLDIFLKEASQTEYFSELFKEISSEDFLEQFSNKEWFSSSLEQNNSSKCLLFEYFKTNELLSNLRKLKSESSISKRKKYQNYIGFCDDILKSKNRLENLYLFDRFYNFFNNDLSDFSESLLNDNISKIVSFLTKKDVPDLDFRINRSNSPKKFEEYDKKDYLEYSGKEKVLKSYQGMVKFVLEKEIPEEDKKIILEEMLEIPFYYNYDFDKNVKSFVKNVLEFNESLNIRNEESLIKNNYEFLLRSVSKCFSNFDKDGRDNNDLFNGWETNWVKFHNNFKKFDELFSKAISLKPDMDVRNKSIILGSTIRDWISYIICPERENLDRMPIIPNRPNLKKIFLDDIEQSIKYISNFNFSLETTSYNYFHDLINEINRDYFVSLGEDPISSPSSKKVKDKVFGIIKEYVSDNESFFNLTNLLYSHLINDDLDNKNHLSFLGDLNKILYFTRKNYGLDDLNYNSETYKNFFNNLRYNFDYLKESIFERRCSNLSELNECASLDIDGYKVLNKLGSGAYGHTYKVKGELGTFALKICRTKDALKEVESYKKLIDKDLKNVVKVFSFFNTGEIEEKGKIRKSSGILEEFVDGKTLSKVISEKSLNKATILNYAFQILNGLKELDDYDLIHRDLKPDNIMINNQGVLKLIDLGKTIDSRYPRDCVENRMYSPPETKLGLHNHKNIDYWSFGLIFYEMITGKHIIDIPEELKNSYLLSRQKSYVRKELDSYCEEEFECKKFKKTLKKLEHLPKEYQKIISKCLNLKPENRYQSIDELILDFKEINYNKQPVFDSLFKEMDIHLRDIYFNKKVDDEIYIVRDLVNKEIPDLVEMMKSNFERHNIINKPEQEVVNYVLDSQETYFGKGGGYLVCSSNDKIMGSLLIRQKDYDRENKHLRLNYNHISTKRGVADEELVSYLVSAADEKVKKYMKENNIKTARIEVNLADEEMKALSIYENNGFEKEGVHKNLYRWGEDVTVMCKFFELK